MNCQTARNLISAYIDCELSPEQRQGLRNHLHHCQECHSEYQQLLTIKSYLEGSSCAAPVEFDSLNALHARIDQERLAFITENSKLYWSTRIFMMTACLAAFFLATFMLFPIKSVSSKIARQQPSWTGPESSIDQTISIDQPVTVYQASLIFP